MKKSTLELPVPSINFHLWEPCNMRCKFCFATFQDVKSSILPKGHLPKAAAIKLVKEICQTSISKITFAGGEPTLCPWLFELISLAKAMGKTTMIVTNGSKIDKSWLNKYKNILDWITISIDSVNEKTNILSGRAVVGKRAISEKEYLRLGSLIRESGIRLKINTVVSSKNKGECLGQFIEQMKPERWKILQVLPISGQNDKCISNFVISEDEFKRFIFNNTPILDVKIIQESNNDMTNSYLMIDPAGRFYQNNEGKYNYGKPILNQGIKNALKEVNINFAKFINRGGKYNW